MEQTSKPTCSLVLPVVGKLISMLDVDKKVVVMDYKKGIHPMKSYMKVRLICMNLHNRMLK